MGDGKLIFCGIPVVLVAAVAANILAQCAFPTLDEGRLGPHECGTMIKMFVFAIVMGVLGPVVLGHMVPGGFR